MKRLVGGEYLLDLTPIEIEESEDVETFTNITNKDVIEQLTNLKKYISNPNGIKPVWVKLKNGETNELIVTRGEFKVVDTSEFEIVIHLDGYKLLVHIEFTQVTLDDDTPIDDWYIAENDAKYLFTTDAQNIGTISELPVFENIVDAQGNKRFIGGNGLPVELAGITYTYSRWSLSGSHLLIVLAGTIANEVQITDGRMLFNLNEIPQWIKDKIVPTFLNIVDLKSISVYADDWTTQTMLITLKKTATDLYLDKAGGSTFTASKDRNFRFAFDLLIDNAGE